MSSSSLDYSCGNLGERVLRCEDIPLCDGLPRKLLLWHRCALMLRYFLEGGLPSYYKHSAACRRKSAAADKCSTGCADVPGVESSPGAFAEHKHITALLSMTNVGKWALQLQYQVLRMTLTRHGVKTSADEFGR